MNEPCLKSNCQCNHLSPCEQGWIFFRYRNVIERNVKGVVYKTENEYDGTRPCPTCDPERAQIFDSSKTPEELAQRLRERSHFKITETCDKNDASRTRTL